MLILESYLEHIARLFEIKTIFDFEEFELTKKTIKQLKKCVCNARA